MIAAPAPRADAPVRALPMRAAEVRYWRRLMRETKGALDDPSRPAGELLAAAIVARKVRLPMPPYSWENPFAILVKAARAHADMTPLERRLDWPRLAEAFDRCLSAWPNVLEAVPPRAKRFRGTDRSDAWLKRKDCGDDD